MSLERRDNLSNLGTNVSSIDHPARNITLLSRHTDSMSSRQLRSCRTSTIQPHQDQSQGLTSNPNMMATDRFHRVQILDSKTAAQVDVTWEMAKTSLAANNNQIVINPSIYQMIGATGMEELKFRLR